MSALALRQDTFHTANHPAFQTHLYAARVSGGTSQNRVNNAFRQSAGTLVLFLHNLHSIPRLDVGSFSMIHSYLH